MKSGMSAGVTYYTYFTSPVGLILLTSDGKGLSGLYMERYQHGEEVHEGWVHDEKVPPLQETTRQLEEYFAGTRTMFDIPLEMRGTPFQLRVWDELLAIPYGVTISYGDLARRVGNSNASRAVGLANGRNPVSIIVPCHRVIGSNGKLTGYGGGLPRKSALLRFEAAVSASGPRQFPPLVEQVGSENAVQYALDFAS